MKKLIFALICLCVWPTFSFANDLSKEEFQYLCSLEPKSLYHYPDYSTMILKANELRKPLVVWCVKDDYSMPTKIAIDAERNGYLFCMADYNDYPGYLDIGYNLLVPYYDVKLGRYIVYNKTQFDRLNTKPQHIKPETLRGGNC